MIQILSTLLGLFIFYKIFNNKGDLDSLLWVVIPMMLINGMVVIINTPLFMPISRWLIFSLIFTQAYYWKKNKANWKVFPLKYTIYILIFGSLIIGIGDPRLSLFDKIYAPFREMTETYIILFLGYSTISDKKDIYSLGKPLYFTMIIVGLYGLFNYIFKSNPYYEFIVNNFFKGGETDFKSKLRVLDTTDQRYRSVSTFDMTFNYGYISTLITIFFLYFTSLTNKKKICIIGIISGFIGTILCFSRTVFIAAMLSILIYVTFSFGIKKIFTGLYIFLILMWLSYSSLSIVQKNIDNVIDVFITGGERTSGSSVSMRKLQTLKAYKYFLQEPFRGNGYDYINKELGWGNRDNALLDSDMYGFESIIYVLLIEQGLIGLVTKLLLFISIFHFFIKHRNVYSKKIIGLGLSLITLFLFFSIGTGALGAWPITMLILGVVIKTVQLNLENNSDIYNSNKNLINKVYKGIHYKKHYLTVNK